MAVLEVLLLLTPMAAAVAVAVAVASLPAAGSPPRLAFRGGDDGPLEGDASAAASAKIDASTNKKCVSQ